MTHLVLRRIVLRLCWVVLVAGIVSCEYGGIHRNRVVSAGGRFAMLVEPARTDFSGSHFLVDSATGDVWMLEATGGPPARWIRLADGPADATVLDARDLLGLGAESPDEASTEGG